MRCCVTYIKFRLRNPHPLDCLGIKYAKNRLTWKYLKAGHSVPADFLGVERFSSLFKFRPTLGPLAQRPLRSRAPSKTSSKTFNRSSFSVQLRSRNGVGEEYQKRGIRARQRRPRARASAHRSPAAGRSGAEVGFSPAPPRPRWAWPGACSLGTQLPACSAVTRRRRRGRTQERKNPRQTTQASMTAAVSTIWNFEPGAETEAQFWLSRQRAIPSRGDRNA